MTEQTNRAAGAALYRAVWRWHFIAGLVVLPFVLLLAVTGGIYLFKDEINDLAHPRLRFVEPGSVAQPASTIAGAALQAYPGELAAYTPAAAPDRSAEVDIRGDDGLKNTIYVDPWTAEVLGTLHETGPAGSPAMHLVRKLHSLDQVGWFGNRMIEAAAGWMVLLVGSGIYLWWPRGRGLGTTRIRAIRGRPWWRDLHAVTGIHTGVFIVFLAMTGLLWSSVWGGKFHDWSYALGLGMPDGYWSGAPASTVTTGEVVDHAPWIMEKQPLPQSADADDSAQSADADDNPQSAEADDNPQSAEADDVGSSADAGDSPLLADSDGIPLPLDAVVARVEAAGIVPGYAISMPRGPRGVFTASVYPDDITHERVIHLDRYSGEILFDAGLADLGTLGRWAEWGISVHMGQEFGLANQIVLLLACLAMVMLCVSAAVMWWKRRPSGALGVPEVPADWRIPRTLLAMAIAAGLFFPLVGLSMLVLAAMELAVHLARRRKITA